MNILHEIKSSNTHLSRHIKKCQFNNNIKKKVKLIFHITSLLLFCCINEYRSKNAFNFLTVCAWEFYFLIVAFHLIMFNFFLFYYLKSNSVHYECSFFKEVFNQSIGYLNNFCKKVVITRREYFWFDSFLFYCTWPYPIDLRLNKFMR